eukprot:CAMPEP_0198218228 /NCGR_PEP_ID=MMETSP1445-20131203/68139_1 /TAXON_ID=36898 /ORGANISM="Pyramimonas sp., Strain CCMP2087" /LENGTH=59 /DNA_ID=CAMNT_0043895167 /DNA_START=219 /DNA_END=398 /DNA_ORIENTATION=+
MTPQPPSGPSYMPITPERGDYLRWVYVPITIGWVELHKDTVRSNPPHQPNICTFLNGRT